MLDTRIGSSVCSGKEWEKTTTLLLSTIKEILRNFVFRDVKITHRTQVSKQIFWARLIASSARFLLSDFSCI